MGSSGVKAPALALQCLALALCGGCGGDGPSVYPVSGSVVYGGRPVPAGMVMFVPKAGGPRANGTIGADGRFALKAPAGEYKVAVVAQPQAPAPAVDSTNWEKAFRTVEKPFLPNGYGDPETSPLKFTVAADAANQCDLKLDLPQRRRR